MAWDDEMPLILRALIDDNGDTPVYTDDRLATQVLVTAPLLQMRVAFTRDYAADVVNGTLTPDPTRTDPKDTAFVSLCCLMAAANLVGSEVRGYGRQGIKIQDGDSRIELSRDPATLKLMKQEYDRQFEDALYAYKTGGDAGLGEVITGPYKFLYGFHGMGCLYEGYPGGRSSRGCGGLY